MNACFAMRLQTAANSFVVVIGSIPAYYRSRALLSRLTMGSRHTFSAAGRGSLMFLKRTSIVRYLIVLSSFLMISLSGHAAGITDATGRTVTIPDRVERIMAAGPNAAVILYVLAPQKMIGWPSAPRPNEREFILAAARDLPEFGRLTGRGDTANVEIVIKAKPDLVFDFGSVSPTYVSLAERVQEQTGIPYLLINGRLDQTAPSIRLLGRALGVPERAEAIARYVEDTEKLIDERLKDIPPAARKRVYLARQPNGLETGLQGSINTEIIERAGGINVAERAAGRGGIANVSIEQVIAWAPDTIITWDANFFSKVYDDPAWASVPAVTAKRVFQAPRLPFGWIDAPPSINRVIGLRWIAGLLYPEKFPEDIRATARDFIKLFYQADVTDAQLDRILSGAQPGGRGR
jgi:iron complex transport system substrate-binding protein